MLPTLQRNASAVLPDWCRISAGPGSGAIAHSTGSSAYCAAECECGPACGSAGRTEITTAGGGGGGCDADDGPGERTAFVAEYASTGVGAGSLADVAAAGNAASASASATGDARGATAEQRGTPASCASITVGSAKEEAAADRCAG